jgi:tetratricopeptide (TPR) repeat protein
MECITSLKKMDNRRCIFLCIPVCFVILVLLFCQVSAVSGETAANDLDYSGAYYYEQGNYDEAIAAFLNEINTGSESAETWYYLGLCYLLEHQYTGALSAFKRAIVLNPQYIDAWNNLGNTYTLLDRSDDAQLAYMMANALSDQDSENSYQPFKNPERQQPSLGFSQRNPVYEPVGPWVPGFSLITY